jgi:hypothetical protein
MKHLTKQSLKEMTIALGLAFFIGLFLFKKCSVDVKSRGQLRRTAKICNGLYVETYLVFGQGAYGLDQVSDWLTDKSNFRMYIGTYDEGNGGFNFQCKGDSVYVKQLLYDEDRNFRTDSLIRSYTFFELEKSQNVDED